MKILIDIGHPAHVHLFRNFAKLMHEKGHTVRFTTRDKEFETRLLDYYQLQYVCLGRHYKTNSGKIWGLFRFTFKIFLFSLRYKPDIYLSHGSFYAAISSWILGKPHISFEDTYNFEQIRLYRPFTACILTGDYPHPDLGKKQIKYSGYHELAYLHPNYFQADPSIREKLGIESEQKYFILRFVSWNASHDIGHGGLSDELKRSIIQVLLKFGKVFISSEKQLPLEFEQYKFPLPPENMHDALAFAHLFIGEGVTMASESSILGTTSIYVNSLQRGYTTEQENKYGLVYNFRDCEGVIEKIKELLLIQDLKKISIVKSKKLVNDKIDVTAFLVWFIESWPVSRDTLMKNPNYQLIFKQ